mmetsp:Transcript_16171/g.23469  ORF Transcript_16171/g.23469 Transcript_16171/m.23469 type:complete len:312 (+) Transcript_16171:37-972(+)
MVAKSKADNELTELLTKLYTMQEDVGVKEKTSDEEKKSKAANIATMGTGKRAQQKGSRFLELRSVIIERVKDVHGKIGEAKELEDAGYGGDNPTQLIKLQAEIREKIRQAQDEWDEMKAIYDKEARKKRSKFTPEELETQEQLVLQLLVKINGIRELQRQAFADDEAQEDDAAAGILGVSTFDPDGGGKSKGWDGGGGGAKLTAQQQMQLEMLEERDQDFDRQLDEIGAGIEDLGEIAKMQGEEVKYQSEMLDKLNDKMDGLTDRMENVNNRMKDTLEEVGRSKDKLIVDIICIVLAIGFAAVFYNMIKNN